MDRPIIKGKTPGNQIVSNRLVGYIYSGASRIKPTINGQLPFKDDFHGDCRGG